LSPKSPFRDLIVKGTNPNIRSHLESYLDMLYARGYAQNTINTYTSMVSKLLSAYTQHHLKSSPSTRSTNTARSTSFKTPTVPNASSSAR